MKLDVIKLAREAGFTMKPPEWVPAQTQQLERFAAIVIEECAKVVDAAYEGAYRAQTAANIRSLKEPT